MSFQMTLSSWLFFITWLCLVYYLSLTQALTEAEAKIIQDKGHMTITVESNGYYKLHGSGEILHETGQFPNPHNPNDIVIQEFTYYVPQTPIRLDTAGCLPLGTIGITVIGTAIYNPYTGDGLNALLNEVLDQCHGHPSPNGQYHYHGLTACVPQTSTNELVGFAMDGYPIYGNKDENGQNLTSVDLDACHGRTVNGQYRYHVTEDFPYYLGCFRGYVDLRNRGNTRNLKCYYANVSHPASVRDLTVGTFNSGITINVKPATDGDDSDPSTANQFHISISLTCLTFAALLYFFNQI